MKAIILAAGKSSRIKAQAQGLAKTCIKINKSESLISRILNSLDKFKFTDVTIVTGYASKETQDFINEISGDFSSINMGLLQFEWIR